MCNIEQFRFQILGMFVEEEQSRGVVGFLVEVISARRANTQQHLHLKSYADEAYSRGG
jgi:hypothetical protein